MVAGAAYLPATDEMFSTYRGGGAWLNGKPIQVSPRNELSDAILSHGDFNVGPDPKARAALNDEVRLARMNLAGAVQRLKCLGSAVVEGAYVASGRFEGYCMVTLKPWDVAVTSLLVEEAGGLVTDLHGGEWNTLRESALFSNGVLHSGLLEALDWDARRAPPPIG
jgi:myo-inositol-1(or 4)-monophosphatase